MTTIRSLYDADGSLVGRWCPETGLVQIGDMLFAWELTCKIEHWGDGVFYLSCGHECFGHAMPVFCPRCGAKVVSE